MASDVLSSSMFGCALAELQSAPDAEKVRALLAGVHLGLGLDDLNAIIAYTPRQKARMFQPQSLAACRGELGQLGSFVGCE